ncbi:MAG: iron-sulfur cluster assembly accessory protein [Deltaproteobacteria bacterium]|nr:iron-sulfur cluster assembly accessory protein [Deltaproteobacteria bacterium]
MAAITVSEDAAKKIHSLADSMNKPEHGLRVKVVGGGCSGLQYKMDLDVARDGDKVFENAGAKVLVDRKSFLYLNGTEVHYAEGLMESGFQLRNPNIKRACGCGASFTV